MTNIIKALNLQYDLSYWSNLLEFEIECYIKSQENIFQFDKNHKKLGCPCRLKHVTKSIVYSRPVIFLPLIEIARFILKRNSVKPIYIRSLNNIFGIKDTLNCYSQKELIDDNL